MTLPDERLRAIKFAEQFMKDLCNPNVTPRVPRDIRARARSVLRHFPDPYHLSELAKSRPDILEDRSGQDYDELYKMVRQYQDNQRSGEE